MCFADQDLSGLWYFREITLLWYWKLLSHGLHIIILYFLLQYDLTDSTAKAGFNQISINNFWQPLLSKVNYRGVSVSIKKLTSIREEFCVLLLLSI